MAHAVVMRVKFGAGGESAEGRRLLDEIVVPQAKSQTGFQSGRWMHEGENGMGVVVFDSADNARAAAEVLKPPPGGPELVSCDVYEVAAEA